MPTENGFKIPASFLGSNGREFAIGSQLGTGSSGTVFTCTDVGDDCVYAVKIVKLQNMRMSMSGEEYEAEKGKLHREVNILRNLAHPNIVGLVDVSESNDSVYVVQELIEGGELFSRITDDAHFRNENVIRFVYCQLADAVLYLHSKSVIHRDIKPENILVHSCESTPPAGIDPIPNCPVYPVIKVVDFGLSKEIRSLSSRAQTWVGTPQYWSPEVIRSRETGAAYDGRADIWSMGVLLFVCLFRRYPFTEPKLPGDLPMQERILRGQFTFPSSQNSKLPGGVSSEAKDLIKQLIEPDVNKRASLESSFSHPWLMNLQLAKDLSHRWPLTHSISIELSEDVSMGGAGLVSEPATSFPSASTNNGRKEDIVPFIFPAVEEPSPSASAAPIVPNIALAEQTAVDQFELTALARIQNEILAHFVKIQNNFNLHPNAFHLMATLTARARELQYISATTVSKFAITAELAEAVIDDSRVFVHSGAIDASLSCVEEIRNSVSEMLLQCRQIQDQYRALIEDVNSLIAGSRIVLNQDPSVRQAIEDILRSETNRSSSSSSGSATPNLNNVVANAMNMPPAGGVAGPSDQLVAKDSTERLLSSSLRDLRRVDDILGKVRFFWANVEQCLLRLDHFKSSSYRLLANVHLSSLLMDRYNVRVSEHKAFWSHFRKTCTEYAQVSQIEYQKFRSIIP